MSNPSRLAVALSVVHNVLRHKNRNRSGQWKRDRRIFMDSAGNFSALKVSVHPDEYHGSVPFRAGENVSPDEMQREAESAAMLFLRNLDDVPQWVADLVEHAFAKEGAGS